MADGTQSGDRPPSGEGVGPASGTDPGQVTDLDLAQAAVILRESEAKARQELSINHPAMYLTWGLVYLIGYGAIWLSVRDQHPYTAPAPAAILGVFLLAAAALAVTAMIVSRATSGVGGGSDRRRRLTYLGLAVGYIGVLVMEAALRHAGASQGATGVFGAAGPILLIGIVFVIGAPDRPDWSAFGLGIWLIAAAALSGFAGAAAVWGVLALAAGAGFLATAVMTWPGRTRS